MLFYYPVRRSFELHIVCQDGKYNPRSAKTLWELPLPVSLLPQLDRILLRSGFFRCWNDVDHFNRTADLLDGCLRAC